MFWDAIEFKIPTLKGLSWFRAIDTSLPTPDDITARDQQQHVDGESYIVTGRSVVVLVSKVTA